MDIQRALSKDDYMRLYETLKANSAKRGEPDSFLVGTSSIAKQVIDRLERENIGEQEDDLHEHTTH